MEATVGKSAIVERKRNLANSDVGLKRLPTSPSGHWPCTPPPYQLGSLVVPHEGWHHDRNEHLILDEVELLDVEIIGFSDNETWLYVPPKANQSTAANPLMALKWCRHILEAPEWKVARRSMCLQLESASCWRRLLISPRAASTPRPPSKVGVVSPIGTPPSGTARSRPPLSETPVSSRPHSQSPIGRARSPTFIPHPTRGNTLRGCIPRPRVDSDIISPGVDEDDVVPHGYKLQDLTDVQVVARLQEEKLRQDCASTSSVLAMRRSLSVTFPLSAPHDLEEENVGGGDSALAPPGCHLCLLPLTRTFSSARDLQSSSSFLSLHPPTSPLPSAEPMRVSFKLGRDKMQRSLPNISQVPSVASASFLHTSQSFDSPGWLTRLQSSRAVPIQRSTRVQSTGSVSSLSLQSLKAAAYVGPAVRNSACVLSPRLLGSRIPVLSKPSSLCLSSLSPHWLTFNGTPRPIASCKVAQPRHGYRNMVRLFST
ncbi:SLAIN motif-containing protein 1-like isoform X2 [Syngnathoides biaculeatus]|uniref:SLAIN motif-containing protein 1-like isoform X2 n=1 Tax=Syngnathoides biaculeatus TaxID=300417 RepID=UPI002ADD733D|nr:SLAIN motif-containing protein 1-like isoform X2 [Syngnathoides biaculeatus]